MQTSAAALLIDIAGGTRMLSGPGAISKHLVSLIPNVPKPFGQHIALDKGITKLRTSPYPAVKKDARRRNTRPALT